MKICQFEYRTTLCFDRPVGAHSFALRCLPSDDARQQIRSLTLSVEPDCRQNVLTDSFGNRYASGYCASTHDSFAFAIAGEAALDSGTGYPAAAGECLPVYRFPSAYTAAGERLRALYDGLRLREGTPRGRAMELCAAVTAHMRYEKYRTDTKTTAEAAVLLSCGVCQDYTHVFLALCRMDGIPCRYCAGLAACDGETHSWAEIYDGGLWYGLDPTNNAPVDEQYLKLSHGRDFADCAIDRGVFLGAALQTQTVESRLIERAQ